LSGNTTNLTGGCQCGAVRYEWTVKPTHSSVCYCRMCQKASGQPFMALTGGKVEHLKWTRGTPAVFRSSNFVERKFCKDCGTQLTYSFTERGRISVAVNSLDDPEAMPPTKQYGIESKVSWLEGIHDLPAQRTDEWFAQDIADKMVNNQKSE
jgi:hypothetical protein